MCAAEMTSSAVTLRVGRGISQGLEIWVVLCDVHGIYQTTHTFLSGEGCIIYAAHNWPHLTQVVRDQVAEIQAQKPRR